jgi:hypothetical protein
MSQLPMSAYFEQKLLPGERIISLVEDLSMSFYFVPNAPPWGDLPSHWPGALALTNRASWPCTCMSGERGSGCISPR